MKRKENTRKKDHSLMNTARNKNLTPSGPGLRYNIWLAQRKETGEWRICAASIGPRSSIFSTFDVLQVWNARTEKAE